MFDSSRFEQIVSELRAAWSRGERPLIETFLAREISDEAVAAGADGATNKVGVETLLDLIYHELLVREEFGDRPTLEEYLARFPALRRRLRRLFELHRAVDDERFLEAAWAEPDEVADEGEGEGEGEGDHERPARRLRTGASRTVHRAPESRTTIAIGLDAAQPISPSALPGYHLLDELGRGGMALVFRARHEQLGRIVALKMMLSGGPASRELLQRFEQEAQAIALLQHPNIVQIHEIGEHAGRPYLALEYVSGGTLQSYLQGRPMPATLAANLGETLARALAFAHSHGVIHRDLKPANILLAPLTESDSEERGSARLSPDDRMRAGVERPTRRDVLPFVPKIADFGLARLSEGGVELTATGHVMGTPGYMAPEQASGERNVGEPADVYAIGAVLYELLTGRPPFQGSTPLEILEQVRRSEPVPPRRLAPSVPRDLETICLKCLAKSPARRYPSAAALAEDLRRFLDHRPIVARPTPFWEGGAKWARRHPALAFSTAALAAVTFAGVTAVAWQAHVARQHADVAIQQRDHARRLHQVAIEESHRADRQRAEAEHDRHDAETARRDAEAARQVAEDNKLGAEKQRAIAVEAQRQAEADFQRAFELVNGLSQVGERLRAKPSQEQEGRQILERALEFYEGLLVDRSSDARTKRVVAAANLRAADIRDSFGQRGRAVSLLQRSLALYDELLRDQGRRPGLLRDLARVHSSLGRTLLSMERRRESDGEYRAAIEMLEQCRGRGMNEEELASEIALNMVSRCSVLRELNREAEAESLYRKAEESLRANARLADAPPRYRGELARCLDDHGRLLLKLARLGEAESLVREANSIFDELSVAAPAFAADSTAPERLPALRNQRTVALCELARGRHVDAQRRLRASLESLATIVDSTALDFQQQAELATAHAELIGALRPKEDGPALEQAIETATAHGRRMLALFPHEPNLSKTLVARFRAWGELTSASRPKSRDGD